MGYFVSAHRESGHLFPPAILGRSPENYLACFVAVDVVDQLNLSELTSKFTRRG
jgi:hypothetical protein